MIKITTNPTITANGGEPRFLLLTEEVVNRFAGVENISLREGVVRLFVNGASEIHQWDRVSREEQLFVTMMGVSWSFRSDLPEISRNGSRSRKGYVAREDGGEFWCFRIITHRALTGHPELWSLERHAEITEYAMNWLDGNSAMGKIYISQDHIAVYFNDEILATSLHLRADHE